MNKSTSRQRSLILAVVLLQSTMVAIITSGLIPTNMHHLEATFDVTRGVIGTVLAVTALVGTAFGLAAGMLAERIGNKRVLMIAIGGQSLSVTLFAFTSAGWAAWLLALVFWSSMNMACVANAISTQFFKDSQKRGVNLLHATNSVGKLVGPLVAILFAAAWRWGFFATGMYSFAILALALVAFRGPARSTPSEALHDEPVLHRPLFWIAVSGLGLLVAAEGSVTAWLPTFLTHVRHFSQNTARILQAFFLAGLVAGRFGAVFLDRRFSHRQIIWTCIVCTIFLFPAMMFNNAVVVGAFLLLHGITFSAAFPTHFSYIIRFFPGHASALSGGMAVTRGIGFAIAMVVSGWISNVSPTAAVLVGAVMMACYAALFAGLNIHERRTRG